MSNIKSVYTDRLYFWDIKKYNKLSLKHFGNTSQNWDSRDYEKVESFLQDYYGNKNIKLTTLISNYGEVRLPVQKEEGMNIWIISYTE